MKLSRIVVYIFLLVMIISSGTILYWLYGPEKVLVVRNEPVPIRPSVQQADNLVFLIVDYCKLTSTPGIVRRFLVSDTVRIPLPLQSDTGPKVCTRVDAPLLIPKGTVPDTYRVHIDVTYQVNPIRQVVNTLDSQPFKVE